MKKTYCLLLIFIPIISIAQQLEYGNNLTITRPVYGNLYLSGRDVIINAPVYGDLVVAGGTVTVNDTIQNDILAAGFIVVVPIIIFVTFITIVGIPVGVLISIMYITLLLLGTIIFSVLLAQWANNVYKKNWGFWKSAWVTLGIFILLKLISLTPVIGWLITMAVTSIAFGSLLVHLLSERNKRNNNTRHAIPVS